MCESTANITYIQWKKPHVYLKVRWCFVAGDVLCQVMFCARWCFVPGDVLFQVTFCGVTLCGVMFCGVTFCRGDVLCQVTFCGVTFCRGTINYVLMSNDGSQQLITKNSSALINPLHCWERGGVKDFPFYTIFAKVQELQTVFFRRRKVANSLILN